MRTQPEKRWLHIFQQICRYAVVGLSGVGVNVLCFIFLRDWVQLELALSSVIAVETSIVNNFIWNDTWTFRKISSRQRGWHIRFRRFYKFNLICLFGLILNVLVVNILVRYMETDEKIAMLVAVVLVTVWNYLLNLQLSWRDGELHPGSCNLRS